MKTDFRRLCHKLSRGLMPSILIVSLFTISACDWIGIASPTHDGAPPDASSYWPTLSADGRYIAFHSEATNLVTGDTNQAADVFVFDTLARTIIRAGVGNNGEQASSGTWYPRISGNGRYVVFHSYSPNLIDEDTNEVADVFVRDLQEGSTSRVSISSTGEQGNAYSTFADITHDGRYIVFHSAATNLVVDDTNGSNDVFLRDTQAGTTTRVSLGDGGVQSIGHSGNAYTKISPDGRRVAFGSSRYSLLLDTSHQAEIFVYDRYTDTLSPVCIDSNGAQANNICLYPDLSGDGRFVTYWSPADNLVDGDTNGKPDTFVHDLLTETTTRISVESDGGQAEPGIDHTGHSSISADGRYVAFSSSAQLHPADLFNAWIDIYVHDRQTGTTRLASENHEGQGNRNSSQPDISGDGRYLAFESWANNLVQNDINDKQDIFLKVRPGLALSSVIPDHLPIGTTTSITLSGSDFLPGAAVWVGSSEVTNVVVVDENTVTADVIVAADESAGAVDVSVFVPGGAPGPGKGSLQICELCATYH